MASPVTSSGSVGGLSVSSIVSALVAADSGTLNNLTAQQTSYQTKLSALGSLQSAVSTYQTALTSLTTSSFNAQTVTSGNTAAFTATSNGQASVGSYSLTVNQLAQQQKLASAGFASASSVVGTGSITIALGTYNSTGNTFTPSATQPGVTINISSSNNTLSGIRDAINAANAGVTATIVNDGSASGNRLVITSTNSGSANSMQIKVADSDGNNTDSAGLSQLAYDPTAASGAGQNLSQQQAAKDAMINLDGINITKSSNTITDAISGLTLNLLQTNSTSASLAVTNDTATVQASVNSFVSAYNTLNSTITNLTAYNSTTQVAGELFGDSTINVYANQLKQTLIQTLGNGTLSSLSQLGVGFQQDGTLGVNSTTLQNVLANNFSSVASLFTNAGTATDSSISYTSSTAQTQAGNYAVTVSQLATQGTMQGSAAPNLTIIQGVNDQVNLNVNSVNYSVTLAPGTYANTQALANALQSSLTQAGASVQVGLSSGALQVTSNQYGSGSSVAVAGGDGASDMFGTTTSTQGLDIAGTINGVAAIGAGQTLTGVTGNSAQGLKVTVNGGALGARGSINYTLGVLTQLNTISNNLIGTNGGLTAEQTGINTQLTQIAKDITSQNSRLQIIQTNYLNQYTALNTLLASLNTQSTFLSQEVSAFSANSSSSSSSSSSTSQNASLG